MVLVDTSVWIDHLRKGHLLLVELLKETRVVTHPLIITEIACGHLKKRSEILLLLSALPQVFLPNDDEVLGFVNTHKLYGLGLGAIDVTLLAAAVFNKVNLWTADKALYNAAAKLNAAHCTH